MKKKIIQSILCVVLLISLGINVWQYNKGKAISTEYDNIQSEVESLNNEQNTLTNSITAKQEELTALNQQLADLESSISELQVSNEDNKAHIEKIKKAKAEAEEKAKEEQTRKAEEETVKATTLKSSNNLAPNGLDKDYLREVYGVSDPDNCYVSEEELKKINEAIGSLGPGIDPNAAEEKIAQLQAAARSGEIVTIDGHTGRIKTEITSDGRTLYIMVDESGNVIYSFGDGTGKMYIP